MARTFVSASNEYLEIDSSVISSEPFTMAALINVPANQVSAAVTVCDKDVDNHFTRLGLTTASGGVAEIQVAAGGSTSNTRGTVTYGSDTWIHICAVCRTISNRSIYTNGGDKVTSSDVRNPANMDRISIGRLGNSTPTQYFNGIIAKVTLWDTDLSDEEVAIFANPFSSEFVRPQNIVEHWDLIRGLNGKKGNVLTASGTTVSEHPRIIMPYSPRFISIPSVGFPDISEALDVTLEMEANLARQLVLPLSSLVEVESALERQLILPLAALLEVEATNVRSLTFPLSSLVEMEALLATGFKMPLAALIEVGVDGERNLTLPISALIEVEAVGTGVLGLEKLINVTLEVEGSLVRQLTLPLSALLEMEAEAVLTLLVAAIVTTGTAVGQRVIGDATGMDIVGEAPGAGIVGSVIGARHGVR